MYAKSLSRCFASLLAGILTSFLVVSAFSSVITAEGSKFNFTVAGNRYENFAILQRTAGAGIPGLIGSARIDSLDGDRPARQLGIMAMLCKQTSSGGYTVYQASDWFYNDVPTDVLANHTSCLQPPAGYYICQGCCAVYVNGNYELKYTYGTPNIEIKY